MAFGKFFGKKEVGVEKSVAVATKKPPVPVRTPVAAPQQRPEAADVGRSPLTKQDELLRINLKKFREYNKTKTAVMENFMSPPKLAAYRTLTLLLHIEVAGLPGYVENDVVPTGIAKFELTDEMVANARKLFPKAFIDEKYLNSIKTKKPRIESLLTIGSIGSIAQNAHSDFDFWVCINEEGFSKEEMMLLKKKLKKIEQWAEEKPDLEVHFFITDIKRAYRNEFGDTDEESTGTAMAKLLKEEFLRSYYLVAGKTPYWSLVPAGANEPTYKKIVEYMNSSSHFNNDNYIDLGPTPSISTDEYFGAALWQINKALSSPYKSVFKMALLLAYVADAKSGLICEAVKRGVLERKPEAPFPDPYLLMFERVLNFFINRNEEKTVDLLRKCMYMKMDVKVMRTDYQTSGKDTKKDKIANYISDWKWDHNVVQDLNKFDEWSFKKNIEFGMFINTFLLGAYRELSDLVKDKGSAIKISQNDLTVLGRKIYSLYSKQPNKLSPISQFTEKDPYQTYITISRTSQHGHHELYNIYTDDVTKQIAKKDDPRENFLYASKSALGAISWIILNRCYGPKTRLCIMNYQYSDDMNSLIEDLFNFFPPLDISKIDSQKLLEKAYYEKAYIVINFSVPRWTKEVKTVGIITRNSWGEMFFHELQGKEGLNKAIETLRQGKFELMSELKKFYRIYVPKGENYTPFVNQLNTTLKRQLSFHFGVQSFYKHSSR